MAGHKTNYLTGYLIIKITKMGVIIDFFFYYFLHQEVFSELK